jgi:hypothetical protein
MRQFQTETCDRFLRTELDRSFGKDLLNDGGFGLGITSVELV